MALGAVVLALCIKLTKFFQTNLTSIIKTASSMLNVVLVVHNFHMPIEFDAKKNRYNAKQNLVRK